MNAVLILIVLFNLSAFALEAKAYSSGNTMVIRHRKKSKKVPLLQRKFVFMEEQGSSNSAFVPDSSGSGAASSQSYSSVPASSDTRGLSSLNDSLTKKRVAPAPQKVVAKSKPAVKTRNKGSNSGRAGGSGAQISSKQVIANDDPFDDANWSEFMVEDNQIDYGESLNVNAKIRF